MSLFQRLRSSKAALYLIELIIVFSGVYLAFLLNKYQNSQQANNEKEVEEIFNRHFPPHNLNYFIYIYY